MEPCNQHCCKISLSPGRKGLRNPGAHRTAQRQFLRRPGWRTQESSCNARAREDPGAPRKRRGLRERGTRVRGRRRRRVRPGEQNSAEPGGQPAVASPEPACASTTRCAGLLSQYIISENSALSRERRTGTARGAREAVAAPTRQGGEKGHGKARDGPLRRAEGRAGSGPLIRACAQGVDAPRPFRRLRTAWASWPARFLRNLAGKRWEKPRRSPGAPGGAPGGPSAPIALPLGAPEPPETSPAKPPG